jgi:outer membrane protein
MFSIKHIALLLALVGLTLAPAHADELFSFKASYQNLNPEGDFAVTDDGLTGTSVDMDDDLDFDDSDDYYMEAALQFGDFRLFAAYQPVGFSGEGVLTDSIRFNGQTFAAGSPVSSDVDLDIYEAGLAWHMVNIDDLPVRVQLGPELAVKYIDATLDMKSGVIEESASAEVPLPTIGLRGRVAISDFLGVAGRAGYMEYSGNSFTDLDAQVEFSPVPLVGLFAGYRYLDIDLDEDDVMVDASFSGPYAGAMIRF